MKYHNTSTICSNYTTDSLNDLLWRYGELGYQLVNTCIAKNKNNTDVMYLFFTKLIEE